MFLSVCRDYAGLGDCRQLDFNEVRYYYQPLKHEILGMG